MSKYDDIINLKYHGSTSVKKMSLQARAAQFAPFAALTGHNAAIRETARLTSEIIELSADEQLNLSKNLNLALEHMAEEAEMTITFFLQDDRKTGGRYVNASGYIKKYIESERVIILSDNTVININNIIAIEGDIFNDHFY